MQGDSDRVPRLLMCTHANEHLFCNLHCVVVVFFLIDGGDICSILHVVCVCVCVRVLYILYLLWSVISIPTSPCAKYRFQSKHWSSTLDYGCVVRFARD